MHNRLASGAENNALLFQGEGELEGLMVPGAAERYVVDETNRSRRQKTKRTDGILYIAKFCRREEKSFVGGTTDPKTSYCVKGGSVEMAMKGNGKVKKGRLQSSYSGDGNEMEELAGQ
ncbi:uncharacterized protein LAJ45_01697 [Morchella importuna]|uniref:uncharacterized protein n=1 Tax=Morchella importuna TaxID=1174673 RepID=UPI001E8ED5B3|nr:uncharacterized protein LAJ45_01697 [Morchella importuna]KAH8153930.1 hypothetical protein LAJ45_01697 [Morchella importuna]